MNPRGVFHYPAFALGAAMLIVTAIGATARPNDPGLVTPPAPRRDARFGRLPLAFEPNRGQSSAPVRFLARGPGYGVFLTGREAVLALRSTGSRRPAVVRWSLRNASPSPRMWCERPLAGKVNYLRGPASAWRRNIATYSRVRQEGVYPGIDLLYHGGDGQLEYDFIVAPGADPRHVELAISGGRAGLEPAGDLVIDTPAGPVRHRRPVAYQEIDGRRVPVSARFRVTSSPTSPHPHTPTRLGFEVAAYDTTKPLVIDPVVVYSTYLGGTVGDIGTGVAVDAAGSAYVTGATVSADFPVTAGALDESQNFGNDAFVAKFNPGGTGLVYSTFIGGGGDDVGTGIAIDSQGAVSIVGSTQAPDFPVTPGAFRSTISGDLDVFVARLNPAGTALTYSSYLGGSGIDGSDTIVFGRHAGIAVTPGGSIAVTATTNSTNIPIVGGFQAAYGGGDTDAFVAVIDPALNGAASLVYSSYLGGSGREALFGAAVASGPDGNLYVTGETVSGDFPITLGAFQSTVNGSLDGYVTRLDPTLSGASSLIYSTYLGGDGADSSTAIVVDPGGSAYITGSTGSSLVFPLLSAAQPTFGGQFDAYVTKLNPTGAALAYSTYLGGTTNDGGMGIAVDPSGRACVFGATDATNFPLANPVQAAYGGGTADAFVTMLSPTGATFLFSTFLGGNDDEAIYRAGGIATDGAGGMYVTSYTESANFPVVNPLIAARPSDSTAFVTKISLAPQAPALVATVASASNVGLSWGPPTGDAATAIVLERRVGVAGPFSPIANLGPAVRSFTDFGDLDPGTTAEYRLRVSNDFGFTFSNAAPVTTPKAGKLQVSPKKLQFPNTTVGESSVRTLMLHNSGKKPVSVLPGPLPAGFTIEPAGIQTIAPRKTGKIDVTFTPTAPGKVSASMTLQTDDPANPAPSVRVTAKAR